MYFGDWQRFHTIVDRLNMVLRRYDQTLPGFITFFGEKRLATSVVDPFSAMRAEMDGVFDSFLGRGFGRFPMLARSQEGEDVVPKDAPVHHVIEHGHRRPRSRPGVRQAQHPIEARGRERQPGGAPVPGMPIGGEVGEQRHLSGIALGLY